MPRSSAGRKPGDPLGTLIFGELARLRRDRDKETGSLVAEARALYPGNHLLLFLEARLHTDEGRYAQALELYDRLRAVDRSVLPDTGPSYDEAILGVRAHKGRGPCFMLLERYAEAAPAYGDAERWAPDDPSLRPKRHLALARAGR